MNRKPENQLEAWAQAALQELPRKNAPLWLSQRVMEQIRKEASRPWYRKPWLSWPFSVRIFSVVGLGGILFSAWAFGHPVGSVAAEQVDQAVSYTSTVESVGRAGLLALANVHPWILATAAGALAIAALATCGFGALCVRVAATNR
ncbi:MAG TPA: hypothetical protein VMF06_04970 [Candidatus Limnocylindria bacterium]|jgi:hypothetical protein|nr:hypothetical protein [Candidatus Limnocylindria bacterium]